MMRRPVWHRHKLDCDLSALISAPCCGCGAFMWGQTPPADLGGRLLHSDMTATGHATPNLYDYGTSELIGPATAAQIEASDDAVSAGHHDGAFRIDCDPIDEQNASNPYAQPVRGVYVT